MIEQIQIRIKYLVSLILIAISNFCLKKLNDIIDWLLAKVTPRSIEKQIDPEQIEANYQIKRVRIVNISSYTGDLIKNKIFQEYINRLYERAEIVYGDLSIPIEVDFSTIKQIKERQTMYILINDTNTKKLTKLINLRVLNGLKLMTRTTPKLITIEKIFITNAIVTHPIAGEETEKSFRIRLIDMLDNNDKELIKERGINVESETVGKKELCHFFLDRELNFGTGQYIMANTQKSYVDYQDTQSNIIDVIEAWMQAIKTARGELDVDKIGKQFNNKNVIHREERPLGLESMRFYKNGNIYFENKEIINLKYDLTRIFESHEKCLLVNY